MKCFMRILKNGNMSTVHCANVQIVFSSTYFPVFRPHTEIYGENLRIQQKHGKRGLEKLGI